MGAPLKQLQLVVNRSVHYAPAESAGHPDLRVFTGLWNEARGDRAMPVRSDLSDAGIRQYRDMIQLFDIWEGGADFRVREIGSGVFRVNGVDMANRMLSEHPNAGVRERLSGALHQVAESGKPIYARFESLENFAVYHRVVESVYLPLGAGDAPDQIIGLTVFPIS